MNVFGIGLPEMALILVLALLVFGPKKLPEIGPQQGKAIKGIPGRFTGKFRGRVQKRKLKIIEKTVEKPDEASLEAGSPQRHSLPRMLRARAEVIES